VFRATAAMPVFYNRPVEVNGRLYMDGGITDAIPLIRAIEAGCTDILVVITRNTTFRRRRARGWVRLVEKLALAGHPRPLREKIMSEDVLFNKTMDLLQNPDKLGSDIRITVISPSDESRLVGRTTRSRAKLWDCAEMGRQDVFNALGVSVP